MLWNSSLLPTSIAGNGKAHFPLVGNEVEVRYRRRRDSKISGMDLVISHAMCNPILLQFLWELFAQTLILHSKGLSQGR